MEIDAIRSIDLDDIYRNIYDPLKKIFKDQMNVLLQGTSNLKNRFMLIFHTNRIKYSSVSEVLLLECVKNGLKVYSKEQKNSYKLIAKKGTFEFSISLDEVAELVKAQMDEFKMCRDPILLSEETKIDQSERSLNPVSFVNIGKLVKFR